MSQTFFCGGVTVQEKPMPNRVHRRSFQSRIRLYVKPALKRDEKDNLTGEDTLFRYAQLNNILKVFMMIGVLQ